MRTMVRRAGDQFSGAPIGVADQSKARMRAPISPLLSSKSRYGLSAKVPPIQTGPSAIDHRQYTKPDRALYVTCGTEERRRARAGQGAPRRPRACPTGYIRA